MQIDWTELGNDAWNWTTSQAPAILGVLVALFVAWIIAGTVKRGMLAAFDRASFDKTLGKFFANLARYVILIAAVLGCLGVFGVDTTSFAAVIGAAGLAIGLAFQGTLANFSAGVMLLIFRPFKVDDFVEAGGTTGTIVEIELFTTELKTPQNVKIVVPNSAIFGNTIKNYMGNDVRRVDVNVGCDYGADIDETRKVLEKALTMVESGVAEPAPEVFLSALGGSSVDWQLRYFSTNANYWKVHQELTRAAKYALDEAGIGIPFPQMDVHIDGAIKKDAA